MKITNGVVEYSQVAKIDDFGVNKKGATSLSFTLDEGEALEEVLAEVTKLTQANVAKMLGKKATAQAAAAPAETVAPSAKTDKDRAAEAAGVGPDAQKKIDAAAEAGLTRKPAGPRKAAETPPAPKPAAADAAAVVEEEDEFAAEAPAAKAIPDADLNAAMTKKNAEIKSSKAIRELVGSFAPAGHAGVFHAHDIPQARRGEFLNKLKELKAA